MARRLPYEEGQWFAVPLARERWAVGRVARMHSGGKVVFAYLFGAFDSIPTLEELEALSPTEAVLVGMVSDLGLVRGEWPVLGLGQWRREEWPLVPLRSVDPITQQVRRVEYHDGDLATPTVWEVTDDEMPSAPVDKLYGHLSLQTRLSRMLVPDS